MKKVVVINAGPRNEHNTDLLIKEAAKGAAESGAEIKYYSLFKLAQYTGCISCFGCKLPKSFGKCICKDGLTEVLDQIREADALIIGSPNYLGNLTASFRALFERLIFQSLTYEKEAINCNKHMIPVLLVMTSNCAEEIYDAIGYTALLDKYQEEFEKFVGPTKILACGNTLQVKDYSKYNWTMFDPEAKKKHHDETFHLYLEKAFKIGSRLLDI